MIPIGDFYISPIELKDAWKLCDFAVSNEDRLRPFHPNTLAQNLTPTLSKSFVEKAVGQFNSKEGFLFIIKEKETNTIAGLIFIKALDWSTKQGEFAYCIGYTFEGQGIMSKAIKALSYHSFDKLGLKTLQIITHKSNIASVKVAENCSFKWIKTLPGEFTPPNGLPLDMELYEKICDI